MGASQGLRSETPGTTTVGQESFLLACPCGTLIAGHAPRWIDAQAEPELLARLLDGQLAHPRCPGCGAEHEAQLAVALHVAELEAVWLVIPPTRRAQVVEELVTHLQRLPGLAVPGAVLPGYLLRPVPVFGVEELRVQLAERRALAECEAARRPAAEELQLLQERERNLGEREQLVQQQGESQAARERALQGQLTELQGQLTELQWRSAELQRQGLDLQGQAQALQARDAELTRQAESLADKEISLRKIAGELEHRSLSVEAAVREHEHQSTGLESRARELDGLVSQLRRQETGLQQRQERLERSEQELGQREQRLAQELTTLEAGRHELDIETADLVAREARLVESEQAAAAALRAASALPPPLPAAPLVDSAVPGALDIELMPGQQHPGRAATSPVPGAALVPLPTPSVADAPPGGPQPPVQGSATSTGLSGFDGLADQLPETMQLQERTALTPIELVHLEELATDALVEAGGVAAAERPETTPAMRSGTVPLPTIRHERSVSVAGPAEEPVFLDDESWSRELDRAWDIDPLPAAAPAARAKSEVEVELTPAVSSASTPALPTAAEPGPAPPVSPPSLPVAESAPPRPAADRDATRRFRIEDVPPTTRREEEVEARARSQRGAPIGPFERWSDSLPADADQCLTLHEGEVYLCLRSSPERLASILERPLDLIVQLHCLEQGAAVLLMLLVPAADGSAEEVTHWLLDHRQRAGQEALAALSFSFRPSVILFDAEGLPRRQLRFERPLEANVSDILWRAVRWDEQRQVDPAALLARLEEPTYDRVGRKQHPFHHEAFSRVESPAQASFALGVLGYWLEADNRAYLTLIKGFPLEELATLTRRVLRAAIDFGIALPQTLEQEALACGLVKDARDLLTRTLASFAEVCLHLRTNDLDDIAEWENWETLLGRADEAGVEVDDEIVRLAEQSMQRVARLAQEMDRRRAAEAEGLDDELLPPSEEPTQVTRLELSGDRLVPVAAVRPPDPAPAPATEGKATPASVAVGGRTSGSGGPDVVSSALPPSTPPDPETLLDLLADEALAADAQAALTVLGRAGAEAILARLRALPADDRAESRLVEAFGKVGLATLPLVADELRKRRRPDPPLDRCVLAVAREVGQTALEKERKHNRRVKDAARRALELLDRLGPGTDGKDGRLATPASEPEEATVTPPPRSSGSAPPPLHPAGGALSGSLEALLGDDLRQARPPVLPSARDSAEIALDDADILDESGET